MFKIKCDDKYIYNPRSKKHLVDNPQLTEELNKSGKLTFNVPPTNANILSLNGLISKVELYNNKELEFAGRVIDTKDNFHNQKNVTVEGELSYLCDSIQRLKVYKCTPYDFFYQVIEEHNKQVTEDKQFKVGMFTIKDANDFIYRYTNYENTLAVLNDKLISSLGGYLRVRHVNGTRYLDLIKSYNNTNTQVIEFKKNLLDFNKYIKLAEIRTAMIPLGYETDKTVTTEGETGTIKERLTILDYPDGEYGDIVKKGDIIYSKTGVAKYGYIYADKKDSTWNDVTVVDNLFNKSVNSLKKLINVTVTIELNAIDLHLIDVDIEKIKLGDMIRVVSKPHKLDSYFLVTKIVKNLQNPQNNKITLGDSLGSFTESINRTTNANNTTVEEIKHTTVNAVEEAQKTATDLLKSVTEGDVQFIDGNLYILDNPNPKKAKKVCRWNKEGWGYSRTGINGDYVMAATLDSGIVADMITTGILRSIEIQNGENFKVDADGNVIIQANPNEKYKYTMLDVYLALSHLQGKIVLPDALIQLYKCDNQVEVFSIIDAVKMLNIAKGNAEPVNYVPATISINPNDANESISLKIDDNLKTVIGLFQIFSYIIKTTQLFVGSSYTSDISDATYGIRLNGQKKEITITDTNQAVTTLIDSGQVDAYNVFASSGGGKGHCLHGRDGSHTYIVHWTGTQLQFYVDSTNIGSLSDERLKNDIEEIDSKLIKVAESIELKQFKLINKLGRKSFGIIAQDLISIFRLNGLNIWDYDLVTQAQYDLNDKTLYFIVDYEQLLLLKMKSLEEKIKKIENYQKGEE